MRTVLFTGVAALALACAAGAMAQTPVPTPAPMATPAPVQPAPVAPDQAAPAAPDQSAAPTDQAAPAPMPHHRRHVHHASTETSAMGEGGEHWSHEPGTGQSGPASNKASNISDADTHSAIAPHLPQPAVGEGATADSYLQAAQAALQSHKTGAAQQALEMAETRLLDRSTPVGAAQQPDQDAAVQQVANARKALATGDTAGASSAIQMALNSSGK
jgi:hypothetical protein